MTGGPNEVWTFGEEAYEIIREVMLMRERLRPYLHEQLDRATAEGLPAMRPLFLDFPDDEQAWTVEDEFLFGPDVLVAPVTEAGARRRVYLPEGASWTHAWSGDDTRGRQRDREDAPLTRSRCTCATARTSPWPVRTPWPLRETHPARRAGRLRGLRITCRRVAGSPAILPGQEAQNRQGSCE